MKDNKYNLNHKLSKYSALGAAFVTISPQIAEAKIIYHDPADITVTGLLQGDISERVYIDMESGGIFSASNSMVDFILNADIDIDTSTTSLTTYFSYSIELIAGGRNGGIISNEDPRILVKKNLGDLIGFPIMQNFNNAFGFFATFGVQKTYVNGSLTDSSTETRGNFVPPNTPVTGFIGIQFNIGGNTHYGWIRVTSQLNINGQNSSGQITLHDFAYEDLPGAPIMAGSTASPATPVPTLGEWGLITLSLFLLSFGTIFLGRKEGVFDTEVSMNRDGSINWVFQKPPFYPQIFQKSLIGTGIIAALLGVFSLIFYGGITAVDFVGTLVAGGIFAYLMHLLFVYETKFINDTNRE